MNTTKKTLKTLAAFVWYTGFMALSIKAFMLFAKAYVLNPNLNLLLMVLLLTLIVVAFKVKYIFTKVCKKNLLRIEALNTPKIWEFYRVRFFIFLISMITLGAFLSRMSEGNYWFLMGVGAVDLSVGLSLLFSSYVFWKA